MSKGSAARPLISIIVPTRGRPAQLEQFVRSLDETMSDPSTAELILVIDKDDTSYAKLPESRLSIETVRSPAGLTMGGLNMAGYRKAVGDWIFLLNDDVLVTTQGWDDRLRAATRIYADEICLIHVNDGIFHEQLCTFPFVSRRFCEIVGGICPEAYIRYRIDDHIYNIFNLLNLNDYNRILYMDDLHFEHHNRDLRFEGTAAYQPDPVIHAKDTVIFDGMLADRKLFALALIAHIEAKHASERTSILGSRIHDVKDSVSLRRPEHVTRLDDAATLLPASGKPRVTIGVVSADIQAEFATRCINAIKEHTSNYELVILDNNSGPGFNHAREMNRILAQCRTEFVVLMDDDVIVEAGWLEGMLGALTADVGVVTPMHKDKAGELSYAGIAMVPNNTGHHGHAFEVTPAPVSTQTICSAIMLIDVRKCGHVQVDEAYSKYFLDIDFGFRIWEAGFRAVIATTTLVTHIGGATLEQGSNASNELFETQRRRFVERWYDSDRWERLMRSQPWSSDPVIQAEMAFPANLHALLDGGYAALSAEALERRLQEIVGVISLRPALRHWTVEEVRRRLPSSGVVKLSDDVGRGLLLGYFIQPVLVEAGASGLDIILDQATYYATPSDEPYSIERANAGGYRRSYMAPDLATLRTFIENDIGRIAPPEPEVQQAPLDPPVEISDPEPVTTGADRAAIVDPNYYGFRIFQADAAYAVPLSYGSLDLARARDRGYAGMMTSRNPLLLKARIRAMQPGRKGAVLRAAYALAGRPVQALGSNRPIASHSWLERSPTKLVDRNYAGFDIYEFEYKFFASPRKLGPFDYAAFKATGRLVSCLVGQSRGEAKALIDDLAIRAESPREALAFGLAAGENSGVAPDRITVLASTHATPLPGRRITTVESDADLGRRLLWDAPENASELAALRAEGFKDAYISWSGPEIWRDNSIENAASQIAPVVHVVFADGRKRRYAGEGVHRLLYNKAYLSSLFSRLPTPAGQSVLEVGCSDGMVCDMLANLGAASVVGIDAMETAGCAFPNPGVTYLTADAHDTKLPSESFDLVVSIATFEHLHTPKRALEEIMRVLKPGGHAYIQAGPLYHSPFGHHMFGFFDDMPWIHLRRTPEEMAEIAEKSGAAARITYNHTQSPIEYVQHMLSRDHVNGLFLPEYELEWFAGQPSLTVIFQNVSYEGAGLLTPSIRKELSAYTPEQLTEHGFEILIRKH